MTLSAVQKDALTRLVEAGASRAASAMEKLSLTHWDFVISSVSEFAASRLAAAVRTDADLYLGACFRSRLGPPLTVLILFPKESAQAVAEAFARPHAERMANLPDPLRPVIGEVANIMAQGVIGALADEHSLTLILSSPAMLDGTRSSILAPLLADYNRRLDLILVSRIEMSSKKLSAECSVILVLSGDALQSLL